MQQSSPPMPSAPHIEKLMIEGPAGQIEVEYLTKAEGSHLPLMIVCHPHPLFEGSMQNKVVHTLCKAANDLGLDSVRFNFRGVGKSTGTYGDAIGECDDLLAVIQWANNLNRESSDIILSGFSFGSYVAAQIQHKIMGHVPSTSIDLADLTIPNNQIKALLLVGPAVTRLNFEGLQIKTPCLIVQGDVDEVVEPQAVYQWIENTHFEQGFELVKVPTGHFFHGKIIELKEIAMTFLQKEILN